MNSKIEKFEDLNVWKESVKLTIALYKELNSTNDYHFRDQMQRAAVSIASNIAEGFERKGNKEFIHFLHIAQGSCAELRTQLYIAKEIGMIIEKQNVDFIEQTRKISAMLANLIKVRREKF